MADWASFNLATLLKTAFPGIVHDRTVNSAKMDYDSDTNLQSGMMRINRTSGATEEYDGSQWEYPDCLDYTEVDIGSGGVLQSGWIRYSIVGRMVFWRARFILNGTATVNGNRQQSFSPGLPASGWASGYASYVRCANEDRTTGVEDEFVKLVIFANGTLIEVVTEASKSFSSQTFHGSGFYTL